MTERKLVIEYRNEKPLELLEYSASISALGDQFKRTISDEGRVDETARLFIDQIRPGSVITELVALGQGAADLYETFDKLKDFAGTFYSVLQSILHLKPEAKELDRATVKNAAAFVGPLIGDAPGSAINIIDNRGGVINNYTVVPMEAAAIRHNAQHLLNSQFPEEVRFENEPMSLFQMRNAPPGKSGDFGIIDRFSGKERKLTFAGDAVKDAILHHHGNPFDQVFWVDGFVKTVSGKVAGYNITNLNSVDPKEE